MATRRRDAFPGKEKATPSPQTGASKLRGAINQISKPKVSTAPTKVTRPATKTPTTTAVSKPQTRRPATSTTASKPAQTTRSRSLNNKTATPTLKARVPTTATTTATGTAAAPRSSSLPVRTVASPKPAPVKTWKPVAKEEGKRRLSNVSAGSGRRSSTGYKKKETGNSVSATKEQQQINSFNLDKKENLNMYSVPEPEMDIEYSYLAEAEEKTVQSLSDFEKFEKGIDDAMREDQELLSSTKIEDMINHADPTVVTGESTTVLEHQEPPVDIKQESEKKQELEHDMNETNNKVEKTADNFHEEAKEKEVKMVEVAEEERAAVVSKADESKEIENPAVEKKQEHSVPQKQQEKMHGKYDSPVSNDVIEETASKLREMRKNKVRALAGAFETVISLQEK